MGNEWPAIILLNQIQSGSYRHLHYILSPLFFVATHFTMNSQQFNFMQIHELSRDFSCTFFKCIDAARGFYAHSLVKVLEITVSRKAAMIISAFLPQCFLFPVGLPSCLRALNSICLNKGRALKLLVKTSLPKYYHPSLENGLGLTFSWQLGMLVAPFEG